LPLGDPPDDLVRLSQQRETRTGDQGGDIDDDDEGPIPDGERNDRLFKLGTSLRGKGLSFDEIREALLKVNSLRCRPPLDDEEVERIAASCARYSAGKESPSDGKQLRSTRMVKLALRSIVERFRDREGESYATIAVDHHQETVPIRSGDFRNWLTNIFYEEADCAPNARR
jgi:hypothetical protein